MFISHRSGRRGAPVRATHAGVRASALIGTFLVLSVSADAATAGIAIGGMPVAKIAAAKYYFFQPWATDAGHKPLRFSISNKPAWAGFDSSTGRLFGTPIPANQGIYRNVTISVGDGAAQATLPAFSITVLPLDNHAPLIGGVPPNAVAVGQSYLFQPTASDPDGNRLVFELYGKPAWLAVNTATGRIYGTPAAGDVGVYKNLVVSVTDGYARSWLKAFDLTVAGIAVPEADRSSKSAAVGLQWEPPTQNSDSSPLTNLAGYHIYYGTSAAALSNQIDVANPGIASFVVDNLAPGTWYFTVAGYNSSGVEGERSDVIRAVTQ